jgi:uncharacterized MAPEG superfamily protein
MTTPFWCLLIAVLFPYVLAGIGGYFRAQQFGTLDNKNPRIQAAALEGVGARVYAAQQNAWEALLVFAAAVFVAHLAGANAQLAAIAAMVFILARVGHAILYLANLDMPRTGIFLVGLGSCVWLFVLAALA